MRTEFLGETPRRITILKKRAKKWVLSFFVHDKILQKKHDVFTNGPGYVIIN
jgi:hypothetical protein